MERTEVFGKVVEAIVEVFEIDETAVDEDMSFESLNADSFDMLELLTTLEDEFNATVDDEKVAGIKTVGAAVDAILAAL